MKKIFGPFTLDPEECLLCRDGRAIEIGDKAFGLLILFVNNPNHLFSKDDLLDAIWPNGDAYEDALFQCVRRLRRILRDDGKTYIKKVPRRGYRWICRVEESRDLDTVERDVKQFAGASLNIGARILPSELAGRPSFELFAEADRSEAEAVIYDELAMKRRERAALLRKVASARQNAELAMIEALPEERRAEYVFDVARRASQEIIGAQQAPWLSTLESIHDKLIASLNYYHKSKVGADRELQLAISLCGFWETCGHITEGREMLSRALVRHESDESPLKGEALIWAGFLAFRQADFEIAKRLLLKSAEINRKIENKAFLTRSLNCLGVLSDVRGRYREAKIYLLEALQLSQEIKADRRMAWDYHGLGHIAEAEGNYAAAKEYHQLHLMKAQDVEDVRGKSTALENLGIVSQHEGDLPLARQHHEQSLAIRYGLMNKHGIAHSLLHLGEIETANRQHRQASSYFQQSLSIFWELKNKLGLARTLTAAGSAAAAAGYDEESARILSAADSLRASISAPLSPTEKRKYGQLKAEMRRKYFVNWKEGSQLREDAILGLICI